ncbi:sigma-54-dependent transcriptional regulator [Novispirillum itersonii]|uniref:DNA-binding NtrC family response regulator n=1 Tax=Novispirillum itersonii TaxID=189 RepID=A0A7W9ZHN2_NOVIT|nr:sigma-54 dependent transcriptional regulator [Novispirillum itersonii]MBB6210279.1 DNA-binding NtrC family response regulator [Novispirillum itersonii]
MTDTAPRILLVEDEDAVRLGIEQALELADLPVLAFAAAEPALAALKVGPADLLITDVRLPGMDGLDLLRAAQGLDPDLPVVLMTGHGDITMAVAAMRDGAYDFIEKPFASERLTATVSRALDRRRLSAEVRRLRRALEGDDGIDSLILGRSPAMRALKNTILQVADTGADVLVLGETGSGKEMVARALHRFSARADRPFVALNCGAIPESMFESELFGHEAGAFTGAVKPRIGKLEFADGGTVFLDEIESMPLALQVKLLRVLEERRVERLGSNRSIALDVRFVAATKVDLAALARDGKFREDLYYRLNVVPLTLPPLRERPDDIGLLLQHFMTQAAETLGRVPPFVSEAERQVLLTHSWPGNVRELGNLAKRAVIGLPLLPGGLTPAAQAGGGIGTGDDAGAALADLVDGFERRLIADAMRRHHGDVTAVSAALQVPRKTLYDKLKRFGLEIDSFR